MTTTVELSGGHQFIDTHDFVTIIGTNGADSVTLGPNVLSATLHDVETVTGSGKETDTVILGSSTAFMTVSGVEFIVGSGGYDAVGLTGTTAFLTVQGIESLTDLSGGFQTVMLEGSDNNLTVSGIETVHGGYGNDTVTLGDGQNALTVTGEYSSSVDTVIGNASFNTLTIEGSANVTVSSIESAVGNSAYQAITLNGSVNVITVSGIDAVYGSSGYDAVTVTGSISMLTIAGVESLTDLSGTNQSVFLSGSSANVITISGIEAVYSGYGNDTITLDGQSNLTFVTSGTSTDTIIGNAGFNTLTLEGNSSAVAVSSIESIKGLGSGFAVALADGGNTVTIDNIETIIGGSGHDAVTVAGSPWFSPQVVSGVESLTSDAGSGHAFIMGGTPSMTVQGFSALSGDSMYQEVHLAGISAAVITINGIDALYGTASGDTITVSGGAANVTGGAGGDTIILSETLIHRGVVFAASTDGSAAGVNSGYDTIDGFDTGYDSIGIGSPLRSEIDKAGGGIGISSRLGGTVDASSDEIVLLTTTVSGSLADSGYQNFRTALGALSNDGVSSVLVIADNGTDTGIYAVKSDGIGGVGAGEVSLLGLVAGRTGLGFDNISVYAP